VFSPQNLDLASQSIVPSSTLSTDGFSNLTLVSATVKGTNRNQVQKNAVLGICWSTTNSDPSVDDNVIFTTAVEGMFSVNMTGLDALEKYYVRVFFASNEVSPGKYANLRYGNVISFETITSEPVYLTWPIPGRNSVWNNNLGIRWDYVTQGAEIAFSKERIRPGLEVVFDIPNILDEVWTVGVQKQNVAMGSFDFETSVNFQFFFADRIQIVFPTGVFPSVGDLAKIKYVGQVLTIEHSVDNGASWQIVASSTFVPEGPYYVAFKSRFGGPSEIFLRAVQ